MSPFVKSLAGRVLDRVRRAPRLTPPGRRLAERFASFATDTNRRFFTALCNHLGSLAEDPCVGMYFEFAVTCNERGRRCAEMLAGHLELAGCHYLDAGCAYAGFLVAFAERGARVSGIDSDPLLLGLARHNLRDHRLRPQLRQGDLTDAGELAHLRGCFDLVTCNDVIEHVADPAATIRNLASLLRPGGLLYMEIPNRHRPSFVDSDGHFQLFGITLLDHDQAEEYYHCVHPHRRYGVGHYLELDEYERLFAQAGLRLELLEEETFEGVDIPTVREEVSRLRAQRPARLATVPEPVRARVEAALEDYLGELAKAPESGQGEQAWRLRYGPAFWRVLGRRADESRSR